MRISAIAPSNYYQNQAVTNFKKDEFTISSVKTNSLNKDILAFGFKPDSLYDGFRRAADAVTTSAEKTADDKAKEAERWLNDLISQCDDPSETANKPLYEDEAIWNAR